MTTTKNSKTATPLAHRVPAEVSDLINTYAEWLTEQTGYTVDPMSVYLGSQLRSTFQKGGANQARLAQAKKDRLAQEAAKAKARAERETAAAAKAAEKLVPAPKATPKAAPKRAPKASATLATADGVVIAEQRHIDATKAV